MDSFISAAQLASLMGLPGNTIRWHCREANGLLYGVATKAGRDWVIPESAAAEFIRVYERWGTLKGKKNDQD
jgi:hypothetical protein